jgi:hypothetical protein
MPRPGKVATNRFERGKARAANKTGHWIHNRPRIFPGLVLSRSFSFQTKRFSFFSLIGFANFLIIATKRFSHLFLMGSAKLLASCQNNPMYWPQRRQSMHLFTWCQKALLRTMWIALTAFWFHLYSNQVLEKRSVSKF